MTPQSTPGRLSFSLPLDAARLQRARQRMRDYLHEHVVDADAVDDIVLAVEEAVTNAVRHSGAADDVLIDIEFQGPDLCESVCDRGVGFDVSAFDPSRPPPTLVRTAAAAVPHRRRHGRARAFQRRPGRPVRVRLA